MPAAPARGVRENRTRYVVLGMLSVAPMSGYALRQAIAGSVGHFWQESFGQLYPTLRRLAAEALVVARPMSGGPGRPGATYAITEKGRRELARWVAQPPVLEPERNEVLLKVFFAGAVDPVVVAQNLAQVGGQLRAHRAELEAIAAAWGERAAGRPEAPFWRLTLEYGLAHLGTALAWLDRAQEVLRAPRPSAPPPGEPPCTPPRPRRRSRSSR